MVGKIIDLCTRAMRHMDTVISSNKQDWLTDTHTEASHNSDKENNSMLNSALPQKPFSESCTALAFPRSKQ